MSKFQYQITDSTKNQKDLKLNKKDNQQIPTLKQQRCWNYLTKALKQSSQQCLNEQLWTYLKQMTNSKYGKDIEILSEETEAVKKKQREIMELKNMVTEITQ